MVNPQHEKCRWNCFDPECWNMNGGCKRTNPRDGVTLKASELGNILRKLLADVDELKARISEMEKE